MKNAGDSGEFAEIFVRNNRRSSCWTILDTIYTVLLAIYSDILLRRRVQMMSDNYRKRTRSMTAGNNFPLTRTAGGSKHFRHSRDDGLQELQGVGAEDVLRLETEADTIGVNEEDIEASAEDELGELQLRAETIKGRSITASSLRRYYHPLRHIKTIIVNLWPRSFTKYLIDDSVLMINGKLNDDEAIMQLAIIIDQHYRMDSFPWQAQFVEAIMTKASQQQKKPGKLKAGSSLGIYRTAITWLHCKANVPLLKEVEQSLYQFFKGYGNTVGALLRTGDMQHRKRQLIRFDEYSDLAYHIMVDPIACHRNGARMHHKTVQLWNSTARGDNVHELIWQNYDVQDDAVIIEPDTVSHLSIAHC